MRRVTPTLALVFIVATINAQQTSTVRNPSAATAAIVSADSKSIEQWKRTADLEKINTINVRQLQDDKAGAQLLACLKTAPRLEHLILTDVKADHLPEGLGQLAHLKELDVETSESLSNNTIAVTAATLPALEKLVLHCRTLTEAPDNLGKLRHLHTIEIVNDDPRLADAYQRNQFPLARLQVTEKTTLGFDQQAVDAEPLTISYTCYNASLAKKHLRLLTDAMQGAVSNGESFAPDVQQVFMKSNALVKPPIPGVDVLSSAYEVDGRDGGTVRHPSGTVISFPADAFVDAAGRPVSGPVSIGYREFRDPVDCFVSGIPMTYDTAGKQEQFKSAGMFDIAASAGGKELFLAPGKKVDVQFAGTDTADTYSFYALDEKQGWKNLGGAPTVKQSSNEAVWTSGCQQYQSLLSNRRKNFFDSTGFDQRYSDTMYAYTSKRSVAFKTSKSARWTEGEYSYVKLNKAAGNKQYTCISLSGKLDMLPELIAFQGIYFKIDEGMKYKEFRRRFNTEPYNDVRVSQDGDRFDIELKTRNGFQQISNVQLVFIRNGKPVEVSENTARKYYANYNHRLDRRRNRFEKDLHKDMVRWARVSKREESRRDTLNCWKKAQWAFNETEKAMDFAQWTSYFDTRLKAEQARINGSELSASTLIRSLSLDGFGVYNCDQIQRLDNPVVVYASYNDSGVKVHEQVSYIIDKKKNSILTYWTGAKNKQPIAFSPASDNILMTVGEQGELALGTQKTFDGRSFADNRHYEFEVNGVETKFTSVAEVRKLIYGEK